MKKLFVCLMALVVASATMSCEKHNNEKVTPSQDEQVSKPASSHIEMYVTSEQAGWNKTLFSADKLGGWWKPTTDKFSIIQKQSGTIQFVLTRGELEYDNADQHSAFVDFCFNFPADIPLVVGTKYYFGETTNKNELYYGVVIENPSINDTNFIELRADIYKFVSTSGWVEFSKIEKETIDGEDVYTLDMTFGFKGLDKARGVATCEVTMGRITNNPGECNAPLYYLSDSGYVAETAIIESLVSKCSNFNAETLVAGLEGKWIPDSRLKYDEQWANITTPYLVMGIDYAEGLTYSHYTFTADGKGTYYAEFEEPYMEPETREFSWAYDAEGGKLKLSGDYKNEWSVSGYSNDYLVLDRISFDGWNYRQILKRLAE